MLNKDKVPTSALQTTDAQHSVMSGSQFLEIVDSINSATTLESLFSSTMKALPIAIGSYHHFPSIGAFDYKTLGTFHSYNMPVAIEEYYRNYDLNEPDPGIVAIFSQARFTWLSDLPNESFSQDKTQKKLAMELLSQIGDALCIPLFGPNNRRGYMFVAGGMMAKESGPLLPYQVQALALLFHTRFCLMIQNIQRQINLTAREAEVIELLTYGKTNKEIAQVLDISVSTVAGHMKSIFIKLEVSDRVSASMRAQSLKAAF